MAALSPVASAIYGPGGKISSSLSFPYQAGSGYSSGKKGVLAYDISNIVVKGRKNNFSGSISCRFRDELVYARIHINFSIHFVDNTLENILGNSLNLSNVNPGNNQNGSYSGYVSHKIEEVHRDEDVSQSIYTSPVITTARYMIVVFDYATGMYYDDTPQYVLGFSISYTGASSAPLYAIENVYPVNVNIKNSINQIFTWRRPDSAPPLTKHIIKYRKKGTSSFTDLSVSDGNTYQTVSANTFDVSGYEYKIQEYTYYNLLLVESDLCEFTSIGQDAAPNITTITNNSIPTISWTDSNQVAYEIRIKDANQKIVYTSGMLIGADQSHQINKMLPNGTYIAEVRELNVYGTYSDWGSKEFVINPSSVAAPTNIFVSVNNKFGVEISGTPVGSAQKTYVVRRVAGTDDIEIVGIYTGGIFTDYTAKGNTYYEYSLRNYNVAYADGAFIPVEVKVKEAIIQDGRDVTNFLDLSWSEDVTFNIEYTDEADRTLYKCLGRRYPVKEMGEWVNSVRSFVAYVKAEDINRLNDMNLNAPKVYFKGNHEYYACDMSIEDQGAYVGGGRMIRFTLTRIADDEGIII